MKKLLVTDYDHTLLTEEKELLMTIPEIEKFREQGNIFVIATSRSWSSIIQEIDKYKIPFDYVCTNVGAGIFDEQRRKIYAQFISLEDKHKIETQLAKIDTSLSVTRFGIEESQDKDSHQIIGYKIKGKPEQLIQLQEKLLPILSHFEIILKEEEGKLFINDAGNTKEKAIDHLLDLLQISQEYVFTIGDDDVDLSMLERFHGYRMRESSQLIQERIKNVVKSVRDIIVYLSLSATENRS